MTTKTRTELDQEMNTIASPAEEQSTLETSSNTTVTTDEGAPSHQPVSEVQPIPQDTGAPLDSADDSSPGQAADPTLTMRLLMVMESVLFVSGNPVGFPTLLEVAREVQPDLSARSARDLLEQLREKLREEGRGIRIAEVAGGYQLRTPSECAPYLRKIVTRRPPRMTRATLETLAMVAYRQPITRSEVEELRGVDCGPVLRHLLEKKLIRILGRKEEPGRPLMYGTTKEFLSLFSLKDLSSLPTLKDFVELSDELRASLGLEATAATEASAHHATPIDGDLLRVEDTSAFTPVGNDEVIHELADVLNEMRIRNRQLREIFPATTDDDEKKDANEETGASVQAEQPLDKPDDPEGIP